jgi:hypothetical protein
MQKKLMLRPTAVPSEYLPSEILSYTERNCDSPENTSSSFLSLDQSLDSSSGTHTTTTSSHNNSQVITVTNNSNNNLNNNNIIIGSGIGNNGHTIMSNLINNNSINSINNNNINHHSEYKDDVKLPETYTTYHPQQTTNTPIVQTTTIATSASFQGSTYETLLTPLSTVPYQEISEEPMYMISDGSEIDRNRLASVLNKDDYGDGTITYVVNFVDY